ncbi:MAG: MORN repeat-containing protein [Alphaproteobacteria bacterium]|nr:MORN repeat-containing protein [Alphaproteobacteria bacterium]
MGNWKDDNRIHGQGKYTWASGTSMSVTGKMISRMMNVS